ncbi:hypothetical protein FKW77_003046 [Venturia effusa]|uniref:Large ribosomal subunit protein eL24-related N-terminal domain-containing protein n=1 Tax=Venturia effusa TaxID=50376 RepID=A0A517LDJ0_9PEZI|nr:hypothetical protein FKW77_003046 [Venturia effusa]
MKRNPRKLGWTKSYRSAHGKEMVVDGALALASRRNVPVRYNRDHVAKALEAMVKFSEIRAKRERAFYVNRMSGNRERQLAEDRKLVAENQASYCAQIDRGNLTCFQHLLPIELRDVTLQESHIDMDESLVMDEEEMDVDMEQEEKEEVAPLKSALKKTKVKQTKQVKMKVGGGFEQE